MPKAKLVQIHCICDYNGVMLNRGDTENGKTLMLGGRTHSRVSSQCRKHSIRVDRGEYALTEISLDPVRSKEISDLAIMRRVREMNPQIEDEKVEKMVEALNIGLYGKKGNDERSRQPMLFGWPEVNFIAEQAILIDQQTDDPEEAAKAIAWMLGSQGNYVAYRNGLIMPAGIIGAMFGRFAAHDVKANIEGAIQVAHSFTTHAEEKQIEFFTAQEELSTKPGAGHMGDTELNSGIYYSYVCIDIPTLVSNTTGWNPKDWEEADRSVAAEAAARLVGLLATVTPGARKGSTAPGSYAKMMLVEIGERNNRSLGGVYRDAVRPNMEESIAKLYEHLEAHDRVYGGHEARWGFTLAGPKAGGTLKNTVDKTRSAVLEGRA